jgi:hypothetical protein
VRVLAVDPGPHIGVASWTDNDPRESEGTEWFSAWEWTPEQFYAEVKAWVMASDVVVCEDFRISGPRAKEGNTTIEMIGALRYLTTAHKVKFVLQDPGAYKFAGSDKLKRLGWYTKGSDHARSASGHLVKYLAGAGLIDLQRLLP